MKRLPALVLRALFLGSFCAAAQVGGQVFVWTGVGNGWKNQTPPSGTGGENVVFSNTLGQNIVLPGNAYNLFTFTKDDDFNLTSGSLLTLSLTGGLTFSSSQSGRASFDSNITINLSQTQVWDAATSTFVVSGKITGPGLLTLRGSTDTNGNGGFFIFNNPSAVNDYSGGTVIDLTGSNYGQSGVSFWNSSPFGSGAVTITQGAAFVAHNPNQTANFTLANNFTLVSSETNPWSLRNWDTPLSLSGSITLASNAFIAPRTADTFLASPAHDGSYVLPGPLTRFPTVVSGNISGAFSLTVEDAGLLILQPASGTNTYTGGTNIGFTTTKTNAGGAVIFANNNAIPTTGVIQVGKANTSFVSGYAGTADVTPGNFATFLGKLSPTSSGGVGVDTLTGTPVTLSDAIDLTRFTTSAQNGIRLGTATSAILTGTITPQLNTAYHFGNGGGTLYVQSNLADVALAPSTSVVADNNGTLPMKLYLQGTDTYTGGTISASGSIIIFDGANALPASGSLNAAGASNSAGNSYLGYTDSVGLTPASFLGRFNPGLTWGIIGFDTHAGNSTTVINGVDLTGFNDGVFLGTATSAILTGTLTPSTVTNADQAANQLRLTAANGGTLSVNSALTGTMGVVVGSPSTNNGFSSGTVLLNPTTANSYSGGTVLNPGGGITLNVGGSGTTNALGTGSLKIAASSGGVGVVGLETNAGGVTIPNNIGFATPDYTNNFPAELALVGSHDFTLAGNITSGPNVSNQPVPASILLNNATPINVTLSGDNSGYFGDLEVVNGMLTLAHNNAGGGGVLNFGSASATVTFGGSALAPIINGIKGAAGSLVLPGSTSLTINTDHAGDFNGNAEFGGVISGAGSLTVNATVNSTANTEFLYLYGHNTYTGGTAITGQAALGLGAADSAGTGTITINAPEGGLALNTGVTLTNPLQFTAGGLAGFGTFAPTSVNGVTGGPITFGQNQIVLPGIPDKHPIPGKLTLATNVTFATGGAYRWVVQDPAGTESFSQLVINGNLDLTSISTAGFSLALETLDTNGQTGYDPLIVWGNSYRFSFVTANGITLFDPTKFTFDVTKFQDGLIPASAFSVTADSTHLYLNFTAVPEPSTWALLATGASLLGLAAFRRRRV